MTARKFILVLLWVASQPALPAMHPVDTVNLSGVQVVADRHLLFHEGTVAFRFDSLMIARFSGLSLGEMISQSLPFPVMSYGGQGSLSGILLRGTTSAQTAVAWNGFPINSLTAGSADLSLIQAGTSTDVSINAGIPGSVYGYGNIGGVVFLSNHPQFDNRCLVRGQYSAGSFHTSRQTVVAMAGSEKLQVHVSFFRQQAENDFLFTDSYKPGYPRIKQSHNSLIHTGFSQAAFLQLPRNQQLEMGLWFQVRSKEIPSIMGSYEPGTAVQRDSITRLYAGYTRRFSHALLKVKTAWFSEYLRYTDRQDPGDQAFTIDSRIRTQQFLSSAEYRAYLTDHLIADAGMTGSFCKADVRSYGGETRENKLGLFAGFRISYPLWIANLTLLKEWVTLYDPPLQMALNGQLNLLPGKLSIRAKLANHYRIPAMNDKYWQPGGNHTLRPEHGGGGDAGISLVLPLQTTILQRLESDITCYSFLVNDWIQWVPGTSFWHAENYRRVWARGVEYRLSLHGSLTRLRWEAVTGYVYTRSGPRSNEMDNDLQLPYVPVHAANASLSLEFNACTLTWSHSYQSRKYTTSDNMESFSVPSCYLSNLQAGWVIGKKNIRPEFSVRVNNLFNRSYESIRSVAMPGRSVMLNLVLSYHKKEKKG